MKSKKEEVKAIIFDVGGVLNGSKYPGRVEPLSDDIHVQISKNLGVGLDTWIDAIDSIYGESIRGNVSIAKARSVISKNLNIPAKKLEKIIIKTYKGLFPQNKELYNYAVKKKKEGYKIAILTDQWPFSKKALLVPTITKKFNLIVVSCDVGMRKPNPKIYKYTLKKLHIKPRETIFIDNREWNLKPAEKIGMKTILFKNNKQTVRDIEKLIK